MRVWKNGKLQPTHGEYPAAIRLTAEETKCFLIDVYAESFRIVEALGEKASRELFMYTTAGSDPDNAHTRRAGAEMFAACVARGLKNLELV